MKFHLKAATPEDAPAIQHVAAVSWRFTYKDIFTPDYIANFVARAYALESLSKQIANSRHIFEVVTNFANQVIGFAHCGDSGKGPELFRLYLLPEYHRQGIGQALIRRIEEKMRTQKITRYFCYVHGRNEIGKSFYAKQAFIHIAERDKPETEDWYMEKVL